MQRVTGEERKAGKNMRFRVGGEQAGQEERQRQDEARHYIFLITCNKSCPWEKDKLFIFAGLTPPPLGIRSPREWGRYLSLP